MHSLLIFIKNLISKDNFLGGTTNKVVFEE